MARRDKEQNEVALHDAFIKLLLDYKRRPTYRELADYTGLHYNTVRKHMKNVHDRTIEELKKTNLADFRILTQDVILGIFKAALDGNVGSQKLWLQLVEGWREGMDMTSNGKTIQIPNPGAMAPILLGAPIPKAQEN